MIRSNKRENQTDIKSRKNKREKTLKSVCKKDRERERKTVLYFTYIIELDRDK